MKHTKSILLILIVGIFFSCSNDDDVSENYNSQTYIPILNNSSWNIASANFSGTTNLVIERGTDIVIGSNTYKKFIDPTIYNTDNYIREDIPNKKVYRNVNGIDEILFDFSLDISDSIILGDGDSYIVTSVTNINVLDGVRKQIRLVHYEGAFIEKSEVWIEGIGSSFHPLKPNYEIIFSDPYIYLTCSAQNGINIYNHGIANGQPEPTDCSIL
ncbi:MAG: hypothetical protein V7719_17780 [Psychroserpens sp.]|uniref:hypothetical protein n=1 Tax=Psychroserpens sp. TaxID=2020870 RepID=UPI00300119E2